MKNKGDPRQWQSVKCDQCINAITEGMQPPKFI